MNFLKIVLLTLLSLASVFPSWAQNDVTLVAEADDPVDIRVLRWNEDGTALTIVDPDNAVRVGVAEGGEAASFALTAKDASLYAADDGMNYVVAKSIDNDAIEVYNVNDPTDTQSIEPGYTVLSLDMSEDGSALSVDNAHEISSTVYSLKGGDETVLSGFETAAPVYNTVLSKDGTHILWHARGTFQLQNIADGSMGEMISLWDFASAYALSPDNSTIAVALTDLDDPMKGTVVLLDAASGEQKCAAVIDAGVPGSIDYSADGSVINASAKTGLYTIDPETCEISQQKTVVESADEDTRILRVATSPDGSSAAVVVSDGEIYIVKN